MIGASIYDATSKISDSINPRGSGATNTITRAKLAAIASALVLMGQEPDEIIATSQASFCMITKYMDSPETETQCIHKVMLEYTLARLLAHAKKGLQTRILKGVPYWNLGKARGQQISLSCSSSQHKFPRHEVGHEGLQGKGLQGLYLDIPALNTIN